MTRPSPVVWCFLVAGALDLIFAVGLYCVVVRFREKAGTSLPPSKVPTSAIAALLSIIGVLTMLAGLLQWIFKSI